MQVPASAVIGFVPLRVLARPATSYLIGGAIFVALAVVLLLPGIPLVLDRDGFQCTVGQMCGPRRPQAREEGHQSLTDRTGFHQYTNRPAHARHSMTVAMDDLGDLLPCRHRGRSRRYHSLSRGMCGSPSRLPRPQRLEQLPPDELRVRGRNRLAQFGARHPVDA